MKNLITWLLLICLVPWITGCESLSEHSLTGKLWNSNIDEDSHFAAQEPNLQLFLTPDGRDVIVQYDEVYYPNTPTMRRAYKLLANQERLARGKKPHFIAINAVSSLHCRPLEFAAMTNIPAGDTTLHAQVKPNQHSFILFSNGNQIGAYELPVYTRHSVLARSLITPFALTGDVIVFGSLFGILVVYGWAQSGGTVRP